MEVEDEDTILERLFFKKYGRALPEKEKEKEKDEVDNIKFVIDLTDESDKMEVATSEIAPVVAVVKMEPIEVVEAPEINANTNTSKVTDKAEARRERKEVAKARKAITAFGKSLQKAVVIPEKEAPLAASKPENVVDDSNMSVDKSVNNVNSVIPIQTVEEINAEMDADQREFVAEFGDIPLDKFDNTGSEFRLYGPDDVIPSDDEDAMIDDV
jgi:type IV secretory pathway VirB10-like protein